MVLFVRVVCWQVGWYPLSMFMWQQQQQESKAQMHSFSRLCSVTFPNPPLVRGSHITKFRVTLRKYYSSTEVQEGDLDKTFSQTFSFKYFISISCFCYCHYYCYHHSKHKATEINCSGVCLQLVISICYFQILWEPQKLILATREFLRGAYSAELKLLFLLQTVAVPLGLPGSILQVIKYSDYYGNHIASIKWL